MQTLILNGGSSSIRFALFDGTRARLRGKLERLGTSGAHMSIADGRPPIGIPRHASPGDFLLDWLDSHRELEHLDGVGHRLVHGMHHFDPTRIDPAFIGELKGLIPFDPEHLPREIELIELIEHRRPELAQVACFDTAFHRDLPRVAALLPIPRRFAERGIRRYGFHGLSYTYLMGELRRLGDPAAARGRVILAHLGSGASLAAVLDGRSIDTSMGFTPTGGLVMGTRSGDLDPGVLGYLASSEPMSADELQTMVNHESGLLGISSTSADVRDLLEHETADARAAEALEVFCYQARKWIGAFAAALGGLDTLVFAGGVGENAAPIRARIGEGLGWLGLHIDPLANDCHADLISAPQSGVSVRVIKTDEEAVIASLTLDVLKSTH